MLQKQSKESYVFFTHFPTKGDKLCSDRAIIIPVILTLVC